MREEGIIKRAVTVGNFDGLHRGHTAVLETLSNEARLRNLQPLIFTFSNHPLELIAPERAPKPIMTADERLKALSSYAKDVRMIPFTPELMGLTARQWISYLCDKLNASLIVIGYDNTFGSDGRSMTPNDYIALGKELGIEVTVAPVIEGCSSSAARRAIASGDMREAGRILSHPFTLSGKVIHGDRIGTSIGFPTANLDVSQASTRLLPPYGVYATEILMPDRSLRYGVTNIGIRPSVTDQPQLRIETHILDFDDDLYGQNLRIGLTEMLRTEKRFDSLDQLKDAIASDKMKARELFAANKEPHSQLAEPHPRLAEPHPRLAEPHSAP